MARKPIPQNYENQVNIYKKNYADANADFPNGFQKDVIQNAIGARPDSSWKNWKCEIYLHENKKGKFLIIEDTGTVGLIGHFYSVDEINEKMVKNEKLDNTERLARFSSMSNSGDNVTGTGLYGIGKAVYSIASSKYIYYFDSIRSTDKEYVANSNEKGMVEEKPYIGDEAKKYIYDNTGLDPKTTIGTRIIIVEPDNEIIDSINSGLMEKYIQESWWLLMQRFEKGKGIFLNGKLIESPNILNNCIHHHEDHKPHEHKLGYRVKNFGFYLYENEEDSPWQGISYYRKGMKIGHVDISFSDLTKPIDNKYWGLIEVDEEWERELAQSEDTVHFGISSLAKKNREYKYLKDYSFEVIRELLEKWGYIKTQKNEDKLLNDELKEVSKEARDLFKKLGFKDLGTGSEKSGWSVRWLPISYPGSDLKVTTGDVISGAFRISSTYKTNRTFKYQLRIYPYDGGPSESIYTIEEKQITLDANTNVDIPFALMINELNSKKYMQNNIRLQVECDNGKKIQKELKYFYEIDQKTRTLEKIDLTLHDKIWPNEKTNRINYGQELKHVNYLISNNRNIPLSYQLKVSVLYQDTSNQLREITTLASFNGKAMPFEEIETDYIESIPFDKDLYGKYLTDDKGVIVLRARLICFEDDDQYEKGERITKIDTTVFLNCDNKDGPEDPFKPLLVNAPEKKKRSYLEGESICINIGHKEFIFMNEISDKARRKYLLEQVMQQYVVLYLRELQYNVFEDGGTPFVELGPQDQYDRVFSKIEEVVYDSWGK